MKKNVSFRVGIAQINSCVGDLEGNSKKIINFINQAKELKVDIICFPELAITGYPPEDLLLKPQFIKDNIYWLKQIIKSCNKITAIVGFVDKVKNNLYNSAVVISNKKNLGIYHKMYLPNYSVFDEKRYFQAEKEFFTGTVPGVPNKVGSGQSPIKFGVLICEDIWQKKPVKTLAEKGAMLIFVINASPFYSGKSDLREKIIRKRAKENKIFIVYNNLVGGQDELVFDGQSLIVSPDGKVLAKAKAFEEDLIVLDINPFREYSLKGVNKPKTIKQKKLEEIEEIYKALVLGVKDYVNKNRFKKVVVAISGGVDSALTTTIACDALGKENVCGVFMPTIYTSSESKEDSFILAKKLGIELKCINIQNIFEIYLKTLDKEFEKLPKDITEENLQARIRGNIIMAFSNKFNWLVLTTGNKSEVSTGYCTLYGDMVGGFGVIKDLSKTTVYKLVNFRNKQNFVIPNRIIEKEPTAELKPNQKDSDTLPVYEILDPILKEYIEKDRSFKEITRAGFNKALVSKVIRLVDNNEYKRRQSAPGIKITPKAFGKDRRMPITNKYKNRDSDL